MTRGWIAAAALTGTLIFVAGTATAADVVQEWNTVKPLPAPTLHNVTLNPAKTGVLVMDFNSKNCTDAQRPRCTAAVPKVAKVLAEARARKMTIVFFKTQRMKPGDFVSAIAPKPGEPYLTGFKENKFIGTGLEKIFRDKGIDTLVIMGTQANGSVMITSVGAANLGFHIVVPVDTMPAATAFQEQLAVWEIANGNTFRGLSTLTRSDMLTF